MIYIQDLVGRIISIMIKEGSPVRNLFLQVSERLDIPVHEFRMVSRGIQLENCSRTLEDYKIEDLTQVNLVIRNPGGGAPTELYSYFDDCLLKGRCPFHRLFRWGDIYELSQKQENAYNLLCRKFNLSDEVIRGIEDNNEEKHIRLADVLHWIYHKDPSITWQRINEIINPNAYNCTCM